MITPDIQPQIDFLQTTWNKLSGQNLTHRGVINPRGEAWFRFIKAGFGVNDLEFLLIWLKRQIREEKRLPGALRFSTLIGDTFKFEEELSLARAESRNLKPAPTPKERVVQAFSPKVTELPAAMTARAISELIAELKRSAGMSV